MRLGKYVKSPIETKRYKIDYSDWLDTSEYVQSISLSASPTTAPALTVAAASVGSNATGVSFYVSGGVSGQTYEITAVMTTTGSQVKEDTISFSVRDQ